MMEKQNVPALRFPEFSGEWERKNGVDLTSKITKGSSPNWQGFKYQDNGVLFVTSENVRDGYLDVSKPKFLSQEFHKKQRNSQLHYGDILINIVGASIGRCSLFLEAVSASTNQAVALFRVTKKNDCFFVLYCYQHDRIQKIISGTQSESARPNLSLEDLRRLPFYCPSQLEEQQKIADFLSSVDEKVTQLEAKKKLLERYKKGMMQKLFNQALRFKDEQGNDYPAWEEKKLGDVVDIVGGGTPETVVEKYWGGDIQWFTPTEIKQKYLFYSKRTITTEGLKKSSAKILPIGALLLCTRATVGDVAIAGLECTTNQGFQSLVTKADNFNEFWYYWILKNKKVLLRRSSGSTFLEISKSEICKIQIHCPHPDEQTKIANFLSSIDDKISLIEAELTHAKTFKKGLLQQMFV